jgi:hypothetical protein
MIMQIKTKQKQLYLFPFVFLSVRFVGYTDTDWWLLFMSWYLLILFYDLLLKEQFSLRSISTISLTLFLVLQRDKVYQWLATGRWFSSVSSTNKTYHHEITEILTKVALNTINKPTDKLYHVAIPGTELVKL